MIATKKSIFNPVTWNPWLTLLALIVVSIDAVFSWKSGESSFHGLCLGYMICNFLNALIERLEAA